MVEPAIPRVKVYEVGKLSNGQARRISGKVQAADRSGISFGVGGTVQERLIEVGDMVTRGQVLAKLDDKPLRLKLESARTKLNNARAGLVEAQGTFDRIAKLVQQKAASKKDLDAATAKLAFAHGDMEQAQASLEQSEIDFGRVQLIAPFDGQVVSVEIEDFQEVGAAAKAVVLQSNGNLEVDVLIPETLIREVDFGERVAVDFPTMKEASVQGEIVTIGAAAEAGNAFPVTIRLQSSEWDLRPGMTAGATFEFDTNNGGDPVYLLPLSAVAMDTISDESAKDEKLAPVYVYDPEAHKVRLRQVRVGGLRGNELEVFEFLQAGELVVSAGVAFMRDGMDAEVWERRR